jgi:hypothetical protein
MRGKRSSVGVTRENWADVFTQVWNGLTIPQACAYLDLDYSMVEDEMNIVIRSFLVDVGMIANVRRNILEGIE